MDSSENLNPSSGGRRISALPLVAETADVVDVLAPGTISTNSFKQLSPRELEILKFVAAGLTNQEIGLQLHLSYHTIRAHLRRIFKKLSVQRRAEAIKSFFENAQ